MPLDRARGLAEAIEGASFMTIEGAGHAVVVEQPQRVVDMCLEFLRLQEETDGSRLTGSRSRTASTCWAI